MTVRVVASLRNWSKLLNYALNLPHISTSYSLLITRPNKSRMPETLWWPLTHDHYLICLRWPVSFMKIIILMGVLTWNFTLKWSYFFFKTLFILEGMGPGWTNFDQMMISRVNNTIIDSKKLESSHIHTVPISGGLNFWGSDFISQNSLSKSDDSLWQF